MRGSLAGDLPLTGLEAPSPFGCVHLSPCTTYSRVAVSVAVIAHFEAKDRTAMSALTRVGPEGIEPSTRGLKVRCSTTELQALALTGPNSLAPPRRSSVPGAGTSTPRLDDGGDPACAAGDHEGIAVPVGRGDLQGVWGQGDGAEELRPGLAHPAHPVQRNLADVALQVQGVREEQQSLLREHQVSAHGLQSALHVGASLVEHLLARGKMLLERSHAVFFRFSSQRRSEEHTSELQSRGQ